MRKVKQGAKKNSDFTMSIEVCDGYDSIPDYAAINPYNVINSLATGEIPD